MPGLFSQQDRSVELRQARWRAEERRRAKWVAEVERSRRSHGWADDGRES